ncbi:MAG: bifunctional phosphopantothenoylcysteine decarboxylase/phosphopantothenate--cysteine ligase CoaBC [Legionellales bacterium]|jgi:phosphopantothenoylcysteine decarboxylase / phosphopantothenate---cysteine ligase|nr:bifunctional phosphopantothenoylcysteine decarboxylase/phosphopantothenate--cysteine ligase CoaBC [Legionellales bacterium]
MTKMKSKKNVLLCITGSIAAYKSTEIIRLLKSHNFEVKALMSSNACNFITPLTIQTLTGQELPPHYDSNNADYSMLHISLAKWADIILIAPATADIISKLTCGDAANLITSTIIASKAKTIIAPAMNKNMWDSHAVQTNIRSLTQRDVGCVAPGLGSQACGDYGSGKMADPHEILSHIISVDTAEKSFFLNKKVLITAGPTQENIDPVRYISNYSSGKMGYALATAAFSLGAQVTVVTGPSNEKRLSGINYIDVVSAAQMHNEVIKHSAEYDVFIATAAVADYSPVEMHSEKIKKTDELITIKLKKNIDILASIAARYPHRINVGFAAETTLVDSKIIEKLKQKKCDIIICNEVGAGKAFNSNYNKVTIYTKHEKTDIDFGLKTNIAKKIIAFICRHSANCLLSS